MSSGSLRPVVLKIGGSVLRNAADFRKVAGFLAARLACRPSEKLVIVVSAEHGTTDALLNVAREISDEPDAAALDLLWSTGEIRSAALLALALQARGVRAKAINVHQIGLLAETESDTAGATAFRALRLRAALASHDAVVAPGFLARGAGDTVVSLGRGGSDLTAVLLAAGLGAAVCELVKDVPGYFVSDPRQDAGAAHLTSISYERALAMARDGCRLVQARALELARAHRVRLVIRALDSDQHTIVEECHGVLDPHDSRRAAV